VLVNKESEAGGGRLEVGGWKERNLFDCVASSSLQPPASNLRLAADMADAPDLVDDSHRSVLMNKDELNGKTDKLKGKVKQAVGDATGNQRLHDEGVADEAAGTVEEGFGKARRKVGDALHDVAHKIKD
jgi:uncharacterized protein YjbJ (UPF0337 family)